MAQFRPPTAPPDRAGAAAAIADALADRRVSTSPRDLISDVGGSRRAAEMLGLSQRTVQRRMSGEGRGLSADELRTLARAGSAARISRVVEELGGARRVAELTGRSTSTVRRWTRGAIRTPRADARQLLGRADAAIRMKSKGLNIDPATGAPTSPVSFTLVADVRVRGASKSAQEFTPNKHIGAQLPPTLQTAQVQQVVDALGAGDLATVQAVIEEALTLQYSACSDYDPDRDIGFFLDRVHQAGFEQQPPPTPPRPPRPRRTRSGSRRKK